MATKPFVFEVVFKNADVLIKELADAQLALVKIQKEISNLKKQTFAFDKLVQQSEVFKQALNKDQQEVVRLTQAIKEVNTALAAAKKAGDVSSASKLTSEQTKLRNQLTLTKERIVDTTVSIRNLDLEINKSKVPAGKFDGLIADQKKYKDTIASTKLEIKNQEKAIAAAKYPTDSIKGMTAQLEKLRNALREMDKAALNSKVGQSMAKQATQLSAAIDKQSRSFGDTTKSIKGYASSLKQGLAGPLQFLSLAGIGAAIANAGIEAVKATVKIEKLFFQIRNLTETTDKEIESFKEQIPALASLVGISQSSLAQSLYNITSAGVNGAKAFETLTISAKAAAVGLGTVQDVSRSIAGIINAYGQENLSASRTAELLFQTVKLGSGNINELASQFSGITPISSKLGVSLEQVSNAIAGLTTLGTPAGEALTQLESLMGSFVRPTERAVHELEQYGLSMAEVRDLLKIDFLGTLEFLNKAFDGNVEAIARVVGRKEGLLAFLGLVGANAETVARKLELMKKESSDLLNTFDKLQDETTQQKWNRFWTGIENITISTVRSIGAAIVYVTDKIFEFNEAVFGITTTAEKTRRNLIILHNEQQILDELVKSNPQAVLGPLYNPLFDVSRIDSETLLLDKALKSLETKVKRTSTVIKKEIAKINKDLAGKDLPVSKQTFLVNTLFDLQEELEAVLKKEEIEAARLAEATEKRRKFRRDLEIKLAESQITAMDDEFLKLAANFRLNIEKLEDEKQAAIRTAKEVGVEPDLLQLDAIFAKSFDALKAAYNKEVNDLKVSLAVVKIPGIDVDTLKDAFDIPDAVIREAKQLGLKFEDLVSGIFVDDETKAKFAERSEKDIAELSELMTDHTQRMIEKVRQIQKRQKEFPRFNLVEALLGGTDRPEPTDPEEIQREAEQKAADLKQTLQQGVREFNTIIVEGLGDIVLGNLDQKQKEIEAELEMKIAALDKEYEIKKEYAIGNYSLLQKLEEEQALKVEKIQKEAAKKQAKLNIQRIIIEGALAIAKTFAYYGFTPPAFVAAALQAAATLKQIAVVKAQGLAEGGEPKKRKRIEGHVKGPGTETSDSIPAWLSTEEYVLNAKMKRELGLEFLEKLRAWTLGRGSKPTQIIQTLPNTSYSVKQANIRPIYKYASGGSVGGQSSFIPNVNLQPISQGPINVTVSDESMVNFSNHFALVAGEIIKQKIEIGLLDANRRIEREKNVEAKRKQ